MVAPPKLPVRFRPGMHRLDCRQPVGLRPSLVEADIDPTSAVICSMTSRSLVTASNEEVIAVSVSWIRFPIWDKWGELTRFWIAAEAALAAEHRRWTELPISEKDTIKITDPSNRTGFACSFNDYLSALGNEHRLYSMLIAAYIGLIEEHGRDTIEYMLSIKGCSRSAFPRLNANDPAAEAAEDYIRKNSVEVWGAELLKAAGWDWERLDCEKASLIEVFAIRNLTAHGLSAFNTSAENRIKAAGAQTCRWIVGQPVLLSRTLFGDYLKDLRAFARTISDAAAH